jgi:hypothetical protein
MARAAADTTDSWLLPEGARPPTIGELEERVELALATARASEAAIMTVGAAAFDAAEQAKRAADLAERASATVVGAGTSPALLRPRGKTPSRDNGDNGLSGFHAQADRLADRLHRLQRVTLGAS